MPNVKTAVSLPPEVFAGFSALAVARGSSRSGVIAQALQKYLDDLEDDEITRSWNEAYADGETEDERQFREVALRASLHDLAALERLEDGELGDLAG